MRHATTLKFGINFFSTFGLQTNSRDLNVWSGRASQEVSSICRLAVLHQCIRPLIGAVCAPGHHGYQRACVLISGQASSGAIWVTRVRMRPEDRSSISFHPLADLGRKTGTMSSLSP